MALITIRILIQIGLRKKPSTYGTFLSNLIYALLLFMIAMTPVTIELSRSLNIDITQLLGEFLKRERYTTTPL
jgi:hypothetical protein